MSHSEFKPCRWGANPHIQTLLPTLVRKNRTIPYITERLEMPDGDFVDLAWSDTPESGTDRPVILIFHGLEGSIDSPYVKGIFQQIRKLGWNAVLMHFRGCSGVPNRLPRRYHSGETSDAAYLIEGLRKRYPKAPLAAVGYSLGGNMLLKYLGEKGERCLLKAAVAVSVPFLLEKSVLRLETGLSRIYERHLLKTLIQNTKIKMRAVDCSELISISIDQLDKLKSLREFDDYLTAPMHGLKDSDDYYTTCSSRQFLSRITCPTLLLQSRDDPFMTADVTPPPEELPENVRLELSDHGGHVGFISGGTPWNPVFWLEERIPEYLRERLAV